MKKVNHGDFLSLILFELLALKVQKLIKLRFLTMFNRQLSYTWSNLKNNRSRHMEQKVNHGHFLSLILFELLAINIQKIKYNGFFNVGDVQLSYAGSNLKNNTAIERSRHIKQKRQSWPLAISILFELLAVKSPKIQ